MHDPIAASRRSALRSVAAQTVVSVLVALAFLLQGLPSAVAAGVGGGALVLGHVLAVLLSLGGVVRAQVAFARLLLGMLVKWCVVIAALVVALGVWRLPPIPMLVGLAAGLLAYLVAMNWMGPRRVAADRKEMKG